jgi:hypothetical protein
MADLTVVVGGALIAVLLVVIVVIVALKRRHRRTEIIIVGPCGAGKTLLFQQLTTGTFVDTVTSMEENEGIVAIKGKVISSQLVFSHRVFV